MTQPRAKQQKSPHVKNKIKVDSANIVHSNLMNRSTTAAAAAATAATWSQGAILIVDKPSGVTCRVASAKALENYKSIVSPNESPTKRSRKQEMKLGHAGTLDPMATGCLPVLLGQATRLQDHIPIFRKRYVAHLRLGIQTETDDADGKVLFTDQEFAGIEFSEFQDKAQKLEVHFPVGKIKQTPPIYSAIHINGQRAYDLARSGQTPQMPEREVELFSLSLKYIDRNTLEMDATVGSGTYIRTLGVDVAHHLFHTKAHLSMLRRLQSGPFSVPVSMTSQYITRIVSFREAIESFAKVVNLDAYPELLVKMKTGQTADMYRHIHETCGLVTEEKVAVENHEGAIVALFAFDHEHQKLKSLCHFKVNEELIPGLPLSWERKWVGEKCDAADLVVVASLQYEVKSEKEGMDASLQEKFAALELQRFSPHILHVTGPLTLPAQFTHVCDHWYVAKDWFSSIEASSPTTWKLTRIGASDMILCTSDSSMDSSPVEIRFDARLDRVSVKGLTELNRVEEKEEESLPCWEYPLSHYLHCIAYSLK